MKYLWAEPIYFENYCTGRNQESSAYIMQINEETRLKMKT